MSAEQPKAFTLTVQTGDEAAEIFIIDSQFHRVDCSVGEKARFRLNAGLYSVKVRAGSEFEEKPVALLTKDEEVIFEPVGFLTPAPLSGTVKAQETQTDNAVAHSTKVHVNIGEGSQVYVFARRWNEKDLSPLNQPPQQDPVKGLTLRSSNDDLLVDFADPDTGVYDAGPDPWSACNVQLTPGAYCLCLQTGTGQLFKQTIIASPGWQTQVFLLERDYDLKDTGISGKTANVRVDLSTGSVFMSRIGYGFQSSRPYKYSGDPDFHLTEMIRQALINNRHVLSKEVVRQMVDGKFENPMLGIYGAHLLLLDVKSDRYLISAVIKNLRRLLKDTHPDVEAIALKLGLSTEHIFNMPPMLRISWNYVLEASVLQPGLVPANSPAYEIAGRLWSGDPWLLWGYSGKQEDSTKDLSEQLKRLIQLEAASINIADLVPDQLMTVKANAPGTPENTGIRSAQPGPAPQPPVPPAAMNDDQALRLVQALGIPRSKLEALMKTAGQY